MNKNNKTSTTNHSMGLHEWSLIVLLATIWGGSFFFIGLTIKELPPLTVVLARVALASIVLIAIVVLTGNKMPSSFRVWRLFMILGCLNNAIPFMLIVWGQTHIDSGLASILNATTPIFSVLLAHFLTREETLTTNRIIGILIGWTGVAVLIGTNLLDGFGMTGLGQLAVLGASLSYAFAAIFARRFKELKPIVVATGMLCCSTIIMTPIALIYDQPWNLSPSPVTLSALAGLAVVCTAFAYLIYFKVLAKAGATNILLVTFLVPISAITLGSLYLGERLDWNAYVGMGIIFVGLLAIDGRLLEKIKHKKV